MDKLYPMIIAAILLCCFLIYKEFKRENKARLLLRILAVVLVVASLLFLIVPITQQSTRTRNPKKLLLVTPGFPNTLATNETYFTLDSSVLEALGASRVRYLPDLAYYLRSHPEVSAIKAFGYGLSADELAQIGKLSYEFEAAPEIGGVQSVSWPNVLPASTALNVQGIYDNRADASVQLILEGSGTKMDSLTIAAKEKTSFTLSSRPKQLGKAIYHLIVKQGSKELTREKVPFTIVESPKLRIMVLAASPDFEFKFLRNWLFENKYPAYFRTRISKEKFSTDAVNLKDKPASGFNGSMFKNFDLLIADDEELAALPATAKSILNTEVKNGLGLVVRINEAKPLSGFAKDFRLTGATDSITSTINPVLTGASAKLKAIPVNQPLFVGVTPEKVSLVENTKGNILVSSKLYGTGKVAASTIGSTYNWVLSGSTADYAQYWSYVINKTARKVEKTLSWKVKPLFPGLSEQVSLVFQTSSRQVLPAVLINKAAKSTQQHPLLPFYWQTKAWMEHAGWNTIKVDEHPAEDFFVYNPEEWTSVKQHDQVENNQKFSKRGQHNTEIQANRIYIIKEELSKWWFFGIFLISIAFLWFETKILQ
jgi:acylphosphatase